MPQQAEQVAMFPDASDEQPFTAIASMLRYQALHTSFVLPRAMPYKAERLPPIEGGLSTGEDAYLRSFPACLACRRGVKSRNERNPCL